MARNSEKYCRNETVLAAFLTNAKAAQIAKAAGISRTTVYKLQHDSEFQAALTARRRQLCKSVVNQMATNLQKNVETLQKIADNSENSPQIRINAIQVIFKQFDGWVETMDVVAEIEKLREAVDTLAQ